MRLVRAKPADGRLFWGVLPWKVTREGMATGDPNLDMLRNLILEGSAGGQAEFKLVFPHGPVHPASAGELRTPEGFGGGISLPGKQSGGLA